ncbi:MAG: APC family permease [Alphaproteobacteria bacterium]|nr:APC family permease [Alphaproteobacteria bacterium]
MKISSFIFGNPLKTENLVLERLNKVKALAVFSSDILSSVAYATEAVFLSLGIVLSMSFPIPIALTISGLLFIIICSYWQTLRAYPNGGGAFAVAKNNLGEFCGLITAASLSVDYILTVAVSLSAGTSAIVSAFPSLSNHVVGICITVLVFIAIANLRGTRSAAGVLSLPTYGFISIIFLMIIIGFFMPEGTPKFEISEEQRSMTQSVTILLVLRAFASGCAALTGIESIAGGVASFKKPQYKNARITLVCMGLILSSMFVGITYLAHKFCIVPNYSETVLSQIAKTVFGDNIFYYIVQFLTAGILFMAVNTSFAGFPRLAGVLAKEKYIPTRFAHLGDRLAYSNGIIALAIVAFLLIVFFKGQTQLLLPLYALGVFTSFTLSQAGMFRFLCKEKGPHWKIKAAISAFGSVATFITLLIIIESKFLDGAWMVLILIPTLFFSFRKINRKYTETNKELDLKSGGLCEQLTQMENFHPKVVVPVSRLHRGTLKALKFAQSLSEDVTAVVVNVDFSETERLKLVWRSMNFSVPLVILGSPYRSVVNPFLDFLFEQDERDPEKGKAIVVMSSFVPGELWQNILHNQTARIFKNGMLYRKQESEQTRVIVEIPYQMKLDE